MKQHPPVYRTYRLTGPIVAEIDRLCRRTGIRHSELVRYLLTLALAQVDAEQIPITPTRFSINWAEVQKGGE